MTDVKKIVIKKEAFRNMITHVLKFGSDSLEVDFEVIGVCMGKKDILKEIINAIPLTHGNNIDIESQKVTLDIFATTEEQYQKKNLTVIGWYCSHPNQGLQFINKDIKNHIYFKNTFDNNCVGIVFDHTLMGKDGDLGFKAYEIDQDGIKEVEIEIEIPKTFDYFNWVKKFVEDSQKKAPLLIKEIAEAASTTPNNLQEIPLPQDYFVEDSLEQEYSRLEPIAQGFQKGTLTFTEFFMGQFLSQLSVWSKQVTKGSLEGSLTLRQTMVKMKEALRNSMGKIERWFSNTLKEKVKLLENNISEYIDVRITKQNEVAENAIKVKEDLITKTKEIIENNIKIALSSVSERYKSNSENFSQCIKQQTELHEETKALSQKLETILERETNFGPDIDDILQKTQEKLDSDILTELDKLEKEIQSIKDIITEIEKH
ncbi:MAG: hypothetical protein ACFFAS_06185 [Promethearchaeota archaeon]